MSENLIIEITDKSANLAETSGNLLTFLSNLKDAESNLFAIDHTIPSTNGSPASWITTITTVDGAIQKFETETNNLLVPTLRLKALLDNIVKADELIANLDKGLRSLLEKHARLVDFDYETFKATKTNSEQHNFLGQFQAVHGAIDELLDAFLSVQSIMPSNKSSFRFHAAAKTLESLIGDTQSQHDEFTKKSAKLDVLISAFNEAETQITQKLNAIETDAETARQQKTDAETDRQTILKYQGDASAKLQEIEAITTKAQALKAIVSEHQTALTAFDERLKVRETEFEEGTKELKGLIAGFNDQEEQIKDVIKQSETMLKGATVAGLAGRFDEIRKNLSAEMGGAKRSFYFGVLFLFLSAIPLFVFVLSPLIEFFTPGFMASFQKSGAGTPTTAWQYIAQISARFVILLPAIVFVTFSSKRYRSLFELREHYAYKYSMAVSVEGFKKQAPEYENEIAAMVLEELAYNPADMVNGTTNRQNRRSNHQILGLILNKLRYPITKTRG